MPRQPTLGKLLKLVERRSSACLSYPEVGASRSTKLPGGYRHDRYLVALGLGDAVFQRAVQGLRSWRAHEGGGVQVVPADIPVEPGRTVVLAIRVGPLWAIAPCRVVYVIEEDDRFGFAYGTLRGHPERGEESFIVERDRSGLVTFRVAAFSRPAELLARIGAPVARSVQRSVSNRYLQALADFVTPTSLG